MTDANIRLIAFTQDHENYGDADAPHWKPKGGVEVRVATLTLEEAVRGQTYLQGLIDAALPSIEYAGDMFERSVINWSVFFEGEYTPDENDQMEYEGRITYPPHTIAELIA